MREKFEDGLCLAKVGFDEMKIIRNSKYSCVMSQGRVRSIKCVNAGDETIGGD